MSETPIELWLFKGIAWLTMIFGLGTFILHMLGGFNQSAGVAPYNIGMAVFGALSAFWAFMYIVAKEKM
jgi:hypothetical protein